jgi:hypothetical protein
MGNQVDGTVDGLTVNALASIFVRDSYDDDNGVHHTLAHVLIGESADLCSIARGSYVGLKNSNVVTLDFEGDDNSTAPVGAGTYPEWQPSSNERTGANVISGMVTVGDTCDWNSSNGPGAIATSGSVTLATSTDTAMTGTFKLDFGTKGSASGSFEATSCQDWFSGTNQPPCQ